MSESAETQLAVLTNDVQYLKKQGDETQQLLRQGYVTKDKFDALQDKVRLHEKIIVSIVLLFAAGLISLFFSVVRSS